MTETLTDVRDALAQLARMREALVASREVVAERRLSEIEGNSLVEGSERPGAIKTGDYWHHIDTIDDPVSLAAISKYDRILAMTDAALSDAKGER